MLLSKRLVCKFNSDLGYMDINEINKDDFNILEN
jgi:hypothetical protein